MGIYTVAPRKRMVKHTSTLSNMRIVHVCTMIVAISTLQAQDTDAGADATKEPTTTERYLLNKETERPTTVSHRDQTFISALGSCLDELRPVQHPEAERRDYRIIIVESPETRTYSPAVDRLLERLGRKYR